jgi:phospholipid/cholesterol/gamma-HCH transport system substrate-binding protein
MNRSPVRDFIVGIFVLAGLAALVYLSTRVGGFEWHARKPFRLTAQFSETGRLAVHSPVTIAGVHVGEVSAISLTKDYQARVVMDLDADYQLSDDTSALIYTNGVLGDRYVQLSPGGSDTILKSGDMISQHQDALILEKLLSDFLYGKMKENSTTAKAGAATAPAKSHP